MKKKGAVPEMITKNVKSTKRIETLKKIIIDLQAEKQQLASENKRLQTLLETENSKIEQEKQEIHDLNNELKKAVGEYRELNNSLAKIKEKYSKQLNDFSELKARYKTNMDKTMRSIKKDFIS